MQNPPVDPSLIKKAIALSMEYEINYVRLASTLVAEYPEIYIRLVKAQVSETPEALSLQIKEMIIQQQQIDAIKKVRLHYGLPLKESKDIIDNLRQVLRERGEYLPGYIDFPRPVKGVEAEIAFDELKECF